MDRVTATVNLLSGQIEAAPADESGWESDFLQALGYLLVQSNELEDALAYVYRAVTGKSFGEVEDDIRDLSLGQIGGTVLKAYEARFPDGEFRQRLEAMRPALKEAIDTRNAFVHARWIFDPAQKQMERERLPRKKPGARELRRLTVADVEAAIEIVGGTAKG